MRSKDRLAELRRLSNGASGASGASGAAGGVYGDTTTALADDASSPLYKEIDDIYQEVERARGWIGDLELQTRLVLGLHAHPTFHNNAQLQEQLESATTVAQGAALKVSGALRQLAARAARSAERHDAAARIARLQAAATRAQYAAALQRHHAALDALRVQRLQLLHDQVKLTNASLSAEECESLLEEGRVALFVANVRADTAQARRVLRDVEARQDALRRAEAALGDVRDLFVQLAHLVAAQQDQLDSVVYYALQARSDVGAGQDHLLRGTVTRTKARKKKLGLILCVAVGVAVVLLVLVVT